MLVRLDVMTRRLDCFANGILHAHRLQPQLHETVCDARDVGQVIEQSGHVIDLPSHHRHGERPGFTSMLGFLQRVRRGRESRQRIAQLVHEDRQELVLALARAPRHLVGALVVRNDGPLLVEPDAHHVGQPMEARFAFAQRALATLVLDGDARDRGSRTSRHRVPTR